MLEPSTGASGSVATRDAVVQPDPPSAPAENKGDAMDVDESSVPSASGAPADAAPSSASVPVPPEDWLSITFKWSGKSYDLRISTSDLVYDLRAAIERQTEVPPAAQKIIGLCRTQLRSDMDSTRIGTLNIKDGVKFTLVGTPEKDQFQGPGPSADEADVSYPARGSDGKMLDPAVDPRNLRRVQQVIKEFPLTVMNEPREGKRLLVLDLDYTMVDSRPLLDGALPSLECARPGLHTFLERVYPHYDIVVWSQTSWRWLESKLVELEVLGSDAEFRICFVADRTTMFPIFSERSGQVIKHEVKPLAYFWAKFPHWSAKNTIHIDDLARNFALNPGEGLRIRAFKGAGTMEGLRDHELERLGHYLVDIATTVDNFEMIDHGNWKKRVKEVQAARAAKTAAAEASGSASGPAAPESNDAGPPPAASDASDADPSSDASGPPPAGSDGSEPTAKSKGEGQGQDDIV